MRRTLAARTLAALVAIWFAAFSLVPGGLHLCPMHGGGLDLVDAGLATHAMAEHAGHAGHHGSPGSRGSDHRCDCLGPCGADPVCAQLPHVALAVVANPGPARGRERPAEPVRLRPSRPAHSRPPSIGPPPLHVG